MLPVTPEEAISRLCRVQQSISLDSFHFKGIFFKKIDF